jgi:diphthine-ammonia ligase
MFDSKAFDSRVSASRLSETRDSSAPWACSWSGGKDCTLALLRTWEQRGSPSALLCMLTEGGQRSRSHGLELRLVEAQAAAMHVPLLTRSASWDDYRAAFVDGARELARRGIESCVFGDIDTLAHREWEESVCWEAGLQAELPLWQENRRALVLELLARGTRAQLVAVREGVLEPELLGRALDAVLIADFERRGLDPCGENGEYHTVVTDAPVYSHALQLRAGERSLRSGVWFLDYALE